jgi:alpha-N-arabinofuranosidase
MQKTLLLCYFLWYACFTLPAQSKITVMNQTKALVSPLLFGEFLERAGNDEPGPEAAFDSLLNDLPEDVYAALGEMEIPIVRFFGGAYIEWGQPDWRDLISHVPNRESPRRKQDSYGYDEYFRTAERLGWQSIIPVHLRKAVWKETSLDSAALLAAGLVAYCNASPETCLPKGMPQWPLIRQVNGHPQPYAVKYFQLGNEWATWMKDIGIKTGLATFEEQSEWLKTCIKTISACMKEVDSSISIIADAVIWSDLDYRFVEALVSDEAMQKHIDFYTVHSYRPWTLDHFALEGRNCQVSDLTEAQKWYAAVAVPELSPLGESVFDNPGFDLIRQYHRRACMTEWNWNGFGTRDSLLNSRFLKGVGAAGFIHALLRQSDLLSFATQSMLLGTTWELNAIRVYPQTDKKALIFPTGQITAFYNKWHGSRLLTCQTQDIPVYNQPASLGNIEPRDKVAMIDALATGDENRVFVHAINRSFDQAYPLEVNLQGFSFKPAKVRHYIFEGSFENSDTNRMAHIEVNDLPESSKTMVSLPARSVSIVVIE